jgi:hypothetical protein
MKTWLTRNALGIVLIIMMNIMTTTTSSAQACACKESINVSLSATGTATVTAAELLASNAPTNCTGASTVTVMLTPTGSPIPGSPQVNCSHLGKTLYGKVSNGSNSCWSRINVMDELRPTIVCPTAPLSMTCNAFANFSLSASDNCTPFAELDIDFSETIDANDDCSLPANVLKRITRTYVVKDKQGLASLPCTVVFNVTTIADLNNILAPLSYNIASGDLDPLVCNGNFATLPNTYPSPLPITEGTTVRPGTGVPTLGGLPITEATQEACNISVSYSDIKLHVGCTTKYIREWKTIEWSCLNRAHSTKTQIIEVIDNVGPTIAPIANMLASTSHHACAANVTFPVPVLADNCAHVSKLTYDINVTDAAGAPVASIKFGQPRTISLPKGVFTVTYRAYDACYNPRELKSLLTVEDNTPPAVICNNNVTVGLTTDGTAWIPAEVIDDKSHDECLMDGFLVRRMTNNCGTCDLPKFNGFGYLGEFGTGANKRYYYISEHAKTPSIALKRAKAMGGIAVSFESMAERTAVNNLVKASGPNIKYLTGYTDLNTDGVFSWESASTLSMTVDTVGKKDKGPLYTFIDAGPNSLKATLNDTPTRVVVEISDPCGWSSFAKFCCADVSTTNHPMVQLRAIDAEGNFNECMVTVQVQDKIGPTMICPTDRKIDCDFVYDDRKFLRDFGWPQVTDNCGRTTVTTDSTVNVSSCRVGTITRNFTATDLGGRTATCRQIITVSRPASYVYNGPRASQWPKDTTLVGCGNPDSPSFAPSRLGSPELTNGACTLVDASHEDQSFNFNNPTGNACFKILRKWTVIDWCKFAPNRDPQNNLYPKDLTYGVNAWKHTQEIKVVDNVPPSINPIPAVLTVDSYDEQCRAGFINLRASAQDACTAVLRYSWQVNVNGVEYKIGSGDGNSIDASGEYPTGSHTIRYTFEDKCGNLNFFTQRFNIVNKKAPTAVMHNGLSINLSPIAGTNEAEAEIWASDFDLKSEHPCGYKVHFSFAPFTTAIVKGSNGQDSTILVGVPNRSYDCDDIRRHNITLYVGSLTPDGVIVSTTVNTFLDVQDNNDACDGGTSNTITHNVAGRIATEDDVEIKDILVSLTGAAMENKTDYEGKFAFTGIIAGNSYTVSPFKNDDVLNGVSTLDIVMIQRHILGLAVLNSPYKMIAADVNKDGKVSSLDLVELRKVILGTNATITNNTSWRFVDKNYSFIDAQNAQGEAFPEVYPMNNVNVDMKTDFISVKIGDVNSSAVSAATSDIVSNRTNKSLNVFMDVEETQDPSIIRIPVRMTDASKIAGMQMTLDFDVASYKYAGIESGVISVSNDNVGTVNADNGQLTFSWHSTTPTAMKADDALIYITLEKMNDEATLTPLGINSDIIAAEAYDADAQVMSISTEVRSNVSFALYQNTPNPFKDKTTIRFDLPEAMDATLTIQDVSGRTVKAINQSGVKGSNYMYIDNSDLTTGLMYYTLKAGNNKSTRKMIIMQ